MTSYELVCVLANTYGFEQAEDKTFMRLCCNLVTSWSLIASHCMSPE